MIDHRQEIALACLAACLASGPAALADLDAYVKAPDPTYSWKAVNHCDSDLGAAYHLDLISQTWQGARWRHALQIFEPKELKHEDIVLLFITGGNNREDPPETSDAVVGFSLALACGARVAVLSQVPNQPLMGGRTEDDLIAETLLKYLETKDETYPLLFPMAKSVVRAMDAIQEWTAKQKKPVVVRFVVSGASKRGWTTWMSSAVDPRIVAIAPMVIPTLNMPAQTKHQIEVWGKYSEQIADYTERGLVEKVETPDGERLWKMIDPYTYRDRITIPKLIINSTNDRYWTLDSLNVFWDDLSGPKYVLYLPNDGHGMTERRQWAVNGVGALFRHVATNREMPKVWWRHTDGDDGSLVLSLNADPTPKSATLWSTRADTRDFREAKWTSSPMSKNKHYIGSIPRSKEGHAALFGDLTFEFDGLEYHLSTLIRESNPEPAK